MWLSKTMLKLQWLFMITMTRAFYAFENIQIDENELQAGQACDIVTCQNLIAYSCTDFFKVFLTTTSTADDKNGSSNLLFSTKKAVVQIQASKLIDEPFISFIEARTEADAQPAAYAFLRVVDANGLRDQGLSTTFLPNRSIYLGNSLIVRANQARTNLQVEHLVTKEKSTVINMLNNELTFDFHPYGALPNEWVIVTCQRISQSCNFYAMKDTKIVPIATNTISEKCTKSVQFSNAYVLLACEDQNSASLYVLSTVYIMKRILFLPEVENNDAQLLTYNENMSVIFFTKKYQIWIQQEPLVFIDSVVILRQSRADRPTVIHFEQDQFYEVHAGQSGSWSYEKHIYNFHEQISDSYGDIVRFTIAAPFHLSAITQNNKGAFQLHQTNYCGLNGIRLATANQNADGCFQGVDENQFLDWVKMAKHGLIEMTDCDSQENLTELQQVFRAHSCTSYNLSSATAGLQYVVRKKHLELDPVYCAPGLRAIGGHCIFCGQLCSDCHLANTDGLIYGFYLDGRELEGNCQSCNENASLDSLAQCSCNEKFLYETETDSCQNCSANCAECESFERCEKCDKLFVVASDGSCQYKTCPYGKYLDQESEECMQCDQSCGTCSWDGIKCLTCQQDGATLTTDGRCICNDGFYFDSVLSTCKSCGKTCATCENDATCKTCPEGFGQGATKCIECVPGEYIFGDRCEKCGLNCLECDSGPNQCEWCTDGSELQPNGTCTCIDGRYFDEKLENCVQIECASDEYIFGDRCQKCGLNCLECDSGPNQCERCTDGSELQPNGTCTCTDGRYFDEKLEACVQCHGSCSTCLSPEKCTTCPAGHIHGDNICLNCSNSAYVSGDECKSCDLPDGCLSCDGLGCRQCISNLALLSDGTCKCTPGLYYNVDECASCDSTCATCSDINTCLTCKPGFIKNASGLCECTVGSFFDEQTASCQPCDGSCVTCSSADRCLTCPQDHTLGETKCLSCQPNQYLNGDTCTNCGFQCDRCESTQCIQCSAISRLEFGACFCNESLFRDMNECKACHTSCQSCEDSKSCLSCRPGYSLADKFCLKCQADEYISGNACQNCGLNCLECDSRPNRCRRCIAGLELQGNGTCVRKDTSFDELVICEDGFFEEKISKKCMTCDENCATCTGISTKCTACKETDNQIIALDDTCVSCGELGIASGREVCLCPEGHFFDLLSKMCLSCADGCKKCASLSDCTSCKVGFYDNNVSCMQCSIAHCNNCLDRDTCIDCALGYDSASNGQVCLKTVQDSAYAPIDDIQELKVEVLEPIDEEAIMYKTMGISVGIVIVILLLIASCFFCWRSNRKKRVQNIGKSLMRQTFNDDGPSFQGQEEASFFEPEQVSLRNQTKLNSARDRNKDESPRSEYKTAMTENNLLTHPQEILVTKNNRIKPLSRLQETAPPSMLNDATESVGSEVAPDQCRDLSGMSRSNPNAVNNSHSQQSRFESSPGRSQNSHEITQQTFQVQARQSSKNMIDMALSIMDDCEIEVSDKVRQRMLAQILGEGTPNSNEASRQAPGISTDPASNTAFESIIRIVASSVKEQVEQAQQEIKNQKNQQLTSSQLDANCKNNEQKFTRVKSASAQRALSSIVGTPPIGSSHTKHQLNENQITIKIAERFEELSRDSYEDQREGSIKISSKFIISKQASINTAQQALNEKKSSSLSVHHENVADLSSRMSSQHESQPLRLGSVASQKILVSDSKSASLGSVKLAETEIDNDTYRQFVKDSATDSDQIISPRKSNNSRVQPLTEKHTSEVKNQSSRNEHSRLNTTNSRDKSALTKDFGFDQTPEDVHFRPVLVYHDAPDHIVNKFKISADELGKRTEPDETISYDNAENDAHFQFEQEVVLEKFVTEDTIDEMLADDGHQVAPAITAISVDEGENQPKAVVSRASINIEEQKTAGENSYEPEMCSESDEQVKVKKRDSKLRLHQQSAINGREEVPKWLGRRQDKMHCKMPVKKAQIDQRNVRRQISRSYEPTSRSREKDVYQKWVRSSRGTTINRFTESELNSNKSLVLCKQNQDPKGQSMTDKYLIGKDRHSSLVVKSKQLASKFHLDKSGDQHTSKKKLGIAIGALSQTQGTKDDNMQSMNNITSHGFYDRRKTHVSIASGNSCDDPQSKKFMEMSQEQLLLQYEKNIRHMGKGKGQKNKNKHQ